MSMLCSFLQCIMDALKYIPAFVLSYLIAFEAASATSILKNIENELMSKNQETIPESKDIAPPDHLEAVKFERDGDLNKNYHKEVFLGREAEKFSNGDYKLKEQEKKLDEIFKAVDLNSDNALDEAELTLWVLTKTREHFYEARLSNENTFSKLDSDKDGKVTWNEYISHFLSEHGFSKQKVFKLLEDGDEIEVSAELDNAILELREKWIQVQDVGEKFLTRSQFLDFQHPETSKSTLKYLVDDIIHDMDIDNSKDISVQEYVAMPAGADVDASKDIWVVERRNEFRKVIDEDRDGLVTEEELEAYLDPLSKGMAAQEARQLVGFGDMNEDGKLTMKEILENSEYYTGSKLFNYAQSVHEEF